MPGAVCASGVAFVCVAFAGGGADWLFSAVLDNDEFAEFVLDEVSSPVSVEFWLLCIDGFVD